MAKTSNSLKETNKMTVYQKAKIEMIKRNKKVKDIADKHKCNRRQIYRLLNGQMTSKPLAHTIARELGYRDWDHFLKAA